MKVLVLDIGNVMATLDFAARERAVLEQQLALGLALVSYRDISDDWAKAYSTGKLTTDQYINRLKRIFKIDEDAILHAENLLVSGANLELVDFVSELSKTVPVACLSNTNRLHWLKVGQTIDIDMFFRTFLSFEIKKLKPDLKLYRHIIAELKSTPDELLYIDDEMSHVIGAKLAGWTNSFQHVANPTTIARIKQWLL